MHYKTHYPPTLPQQQRRCMPQIALCNGHAQSYTRATGGVCDVTAHAIMFDAAGRRLLPGKRRVTSRNLELPRSTMSITLSLRVLRPFFRLYPLLFLSSFFQRTLVCIRCCQAECFFIFRSAQVHSRERHVWIIIFIYIIFFVSYTRLHR